MIKNVQKKEIRYIELFAGVGGFRLGIERAFKERNKHGQSEILRAKCVFTNEWDKYCCQVYNKNFGTRIIPTNIRTIKAGSIPDFDLLCAGFPCQAFSIAGKRKGFQDSRGTLFFEIAKILKAKRPKFVFLENVKGLLNHEKGKTFRVILKALSELGYELQWMVLNSKFFGVPQNRERVFIIGSLGGETRPEILPFRKSSEEIDKQQQGLSFPTVFSSQHKIARGMPMIKCDETKIAALRSYPRNESIKDNPNQNRFQNIEINEDGTTNALSSVQKDNLVIKRIQFDTSGKGYKSQEDRVHSPDGIMCCLPNSNPANKLNIFDEKEPKIIRGRPKMPYEPGKRELNYTEYKDACPSLTVNCASGDQKNIVMPNIRRLTPIECERLQGFPDNWTEGVSDTQRYKMMGNAVTVNVIKAISEKLLNS